jgi:hypothetical protein
MPPSPTQHPLGETKEERNLRREHLLKHGEAFVSAFVNEGPKKTPVPKVSPENAAAQERRP